MKRQWFYRGKLKSCNYTCSYCPFSKGNMSLRELQKDKEAWFRFVEHMNGQADIGGALQIVPYGEALIYPHYWEGLATLSQNPRIDAVGAQSNLSFPVEQMLYYYLEHGGQPEKLRLWGTFHPEMTTIEEFIHQCNILSKWNILYCIGAVGQPENLKYIKRLRQALPLSVYVWINKMEGLGRNYTTEEINAFLEIDSYFDMELKHHKADTAKCGDNNFIESDGTIHRCNLCRRSLGNLYYNSQILNQATERNKVPPQKTLCTRKECSCFLAYCNRKEESLVFFEPYPAFRIPVYPKAVFFDIDGTLIPEGEKTIPEKTAKKLHHLAKYSAIYLATSRPYEMAKRGLRAIWDIIAGGTFANGARQMIWKDNKLDEITEMETGWLERAEHLQKTSGYKIHKYKKGNHIYKVTLVYPKNRLPQNACWQLQEELSHKLELPDTCQILWEEPCLQITAKGTGKLEGILSICKKMGYQKDEVTVFGNSKNDLPMINYFSKNL